MPSGKKPVPRSGALGRVNSQRALASALGRGASTVHEWIHRPDWPFGKRGPWDVEAVRTWVKRTLQKGPEDVGAVPAVLDDDAKAAARELLKTDPLKVARIQKVRQETELLRRRVAGFDELYVDKAAARAEAIAVAKNIASAIMAEPASAAAALDADGLLVMRAKAKARKLLTERFEALCNRLADGLGDAVDRAGK